MGFARIDAMNIASRMESAGVPRRIQVFQYAADKVMLQGKDNRLVPGKKKLLQRAEARCKRTFWNRRKQVPRRLSAQVYLGED